jgi:hypothetical protein
MPSNLNNTTKCGAGQKMRVNPCIAISQVALNVMKALPQPANNGLVNNVPNAEYDFTNNNQGDVKIDWAPTEKDHVYARYSQQSLVQQFVNGQQVLYSTNGNENLPLWNGVINYTRTLKPTLGVCRNETQVSGCGVGVWAARPPNVAK